MNETFNLVEAVEALAGDLDAGGEREWSRALRDALTGSVVPGEFLGETREQLRRLRRDPVSARLNLRKRLDTATAYLDKALGGRWRA